MWQIGLEVEEEGLSGEVLGGFPEGWVWVWVCGCVGVWVWVWVCMRACARVLLVTCVACTRISVRCKGGICIKKYLSARTYFLVFCKCPLYPRIAKEIEEKRTRDSHVQSKYY